MSTDITQKNQKMTLLLLIIMMAVLVTIVIYFGIIKPKQMALNAKDIKIDGVVITPAKEVNDFKLTDNKGNTFTKDNLKGHWTMMFFGFTNCGMVCPATMSALNKTYQLLQKELPEDKLPQVVMVSVDPERDTYQKMNTYVTTFNPNFIGTSTDMLQTEKLEKEFHIVAIKKQEGNDKNNYYYDHSAEILLFNPEAKLQAYLSYPHVPEQMVKDYKLIMHGVKL